MKRSILPHLIPALILATIWPVGNPDEARPIGNSWGEIQEYEDRLYLHPGVDVMGETIGQPVHAVAAGEVKAWLTISGDWHWRLAIADSSTNDSCNGWLYAHIDFYRDHKEVGDWVEEGDLIGYLVEWPGGFDHLHWARIMGAGANWTSDWLFVDNPSIELDPSGDTVAPIFENTLESDLFAFRPNNASAMTEYLSPDSLYGDVDIIARIHDKTGEAWDGIPDTVWERLAPMEAWYEVHGQRLKESIRSFLLDGHLEWDKNIEVIYSRDYTCRSTGNYEEREYYFVLTNTDGDSLREESDYDSCWHTTEFPDGDYWVVVTTKDAVGNQTIDSMQVTLVNGNPGVVEGTEPETAFTLLTPLVVHATPLTFVCPRTDRIRIYDVSGREQLVQVLVPSQEPQSININTLPCGLYYIKADSGVPIQRFVIVR